MGDGTQLVTAAVAFQVTPGFKLSAGLKIWEESFYNYNISLNGIENILKQSNAGLLIQLGLEKNRGNELEKIETYPLLYEYFGAHAGIGGHWKFGRFEITESRVDYNYNFNDKDSVSLVTYTAGIRYLLWVWLGYSIRGRNGMIVDTPMDDYSHEFSLAKEIPLVLNSTFFLKYLFSIYDNEEEKEWGYRTSLFEIGIQRQTGSLRNLLDFQYKIGEFGETVKSRYDSYVLTLETKIML